MSPRWKCVSRETFLLQWRPLFRFYCSFLVVDETRECCSVGREWLIVCSEIINEDEDAAGNNKNSPLNTKYSDLLSSTTLRQNVKNKVKSLFLEFKGKQYLISVLNTILKCSLVVVSKSIRTLGTCLHWSIFVCVSYSSWQDRSSEKESGAVSGARLLLCHAIF